MIEQDLSSKCVVKPFVHYLTHSALVEEMNFSHAVKSEETKFCISVHVTFAISVKDLERKTLDVEHHLIESAICQVSLAL